VGSWLPYPAFSTDQDIGAKFGTMFSLLMERFDEVQFFSSHRVSDFCAWARAEKGELTRIFAYGDGGVLMNVGDQTPEEAELGLTDLTGLSLSDADDRIFSVAEDLDEEQEALVASGLSQDEAYERVHENGRHAFPTEDDVIDLSALWSLDPTRLSEMDHPPGLGLAARLPESMRQ
jgi:hypothetical protein